MAGLCEAGRYVILTRDAEGEVVDIHDRMPVLLEPEEAQLWLRKGDLGQGPALTRTRVSPRVNRVEHDDPDCVAPVSQQSFDFD